jgi:hypothetical protein
MAINKTVVGIYSSDGTTLTKLTESVTNLTSGLLTSTNTRYAQAVETAQTLYPGQVYYVALLVDAGTAGNTQGFVKTANVVAPTAGDQAPAMYTKASESTLAATYAISALTEASDLVPYIALIP